MKKYLTRFHRDEDGAVTVDWVVLTAGLLILGIVVVLSIQTGASGMSADIGSELGGATVPTVVF